MHPYVIAFRDDQRRLVTQTRFASSIWFLLDKTAIALGDELIAIRRFDLEEIDAFSCAGHLPQISNMIGLVSSSASAQLARAYVILVEENEKEEPTQIVRFGQSLAQCLRTFTIRQGPSGAPLADFGPGASVIAIRQLTQNEIEELVSHSVQPTF